MAKKNNLPAEAYAKPHTMTGESVDIDTVMAPYERTGAQQMAEMNIGAGLITKGPKATKTDGITMRGHGAATKGIKSRGPMG
jgi:hypothetical protein